MTSARRNLRREARRWVAEIDARCCGVWPADLRWDMWRRAQADLERQDVRLSRAVKALHAEAWRKTTRLDADAYLDYIKRTTARTINHLLKIRLELGLPLPSWATRRAPMLEHRIRRDRARAAATRRHAAGRTGR